MSFPEEYVTLYLRLLRAAEKDDTRELYILHEQNSLLLHGPSLWGENENPLHVSCKHGSVRFVIEVLNLNPGLARRRRNSDGFSPMHVASANGHVEIVQVLADFDSKLCLVEDIEDRVPLHVAAMKGKGDAVRALVHACPESLRKLTCRGETALHVALKNHQTGAFIVLLEEIQKWKHEDLLNWKDIEGNTVLHIVTSRKLIQILELLLSLNLNSTNGTVMVDVNSINGRGYTPLDLHYETTANDMLAREIRIVLHDAGAVEGRSLNHLTAAAQPPPPQPSPPSTAESQLPQKLLPVKIRNSLLTVLIMAATFAFTSSNPPNYFNLQVVSDVKHPPPGLTLSSLVLGSKSNNQYRGIFYYMMFNIAGFLASMCAILVLVRPLPHSSVVSFVMVTMFIAYLLVVDKIMPSFSVILLGSLEISSTPLVWLSALAFIFCGFMISLLVKLFHGVYNRWKSSRGHA
ncbi:Ankyrin repeat-containing protein BDA1 [Camellia lanceoleosa]|uniref:Ankyrin repeat-containing protein BDA1 n=1 Tax=Camellia lanceoleosa TaxID=1840588 RepID=A0ACC0IX63_9ERIC|nr:Ankyrin repeat-containing protein BDA1 [Camellia lanceoleosa]